MHKKTTIFLFEIYSRHTIIIQGIKLKMFAMNFFFFNLSDYIFVSDESNFRFILEMLNTSKKSRDLELLAILEKFKIVPILI